MNETRPRRAAVFLAVFGTVCLVTLVLLALGLVHTRFSGDRVDLVAVAALGVCVPICAAGAIDLWKRGGRADDS